MQDYERNMSMSEMDLNAIRGRADVTATNLRNGASFHETLGANAPTVEKMRRAAKVMTEDIPALLSLVESLTAERDENWKLAEEYLAQRNEYIGFYNTASGAFEQAARAWSEGRATTEGTPDQ